LRQIRQLQAAGHSLEEIRHLLEGGSTRSVSDVAPQTKAVRAGAPPALRAELWRRVRVMEGLELSFDAGRFNPSVEQLVALREIIASSFKRGSTENDHDDDD
jgi:DNA-binding transcriptional MerR regulator